MEPDDIIPDESRPDDPVRQSWSSHINEQLRRLWRDSHYSGGVLPSDAVLWPRFDPTVQPATNRPVVPTDQISPEEYGGITPYRRSPPPWGETTIAPTYENIWQGNPADLWRAIGVWVDGCELESHVKYLTDMSNIQERMVNEWITAMDGHYSLLNPINIGDFKTGVKGHDRAILRGNARHWFNWNRPSFIEAYLNYNPHNMDNAETDLFLEGFLGVNPEITHQYKVWVVLRGLESLYPQQEVQVLEAINKVYGGSHPMLTPPEMIVEFYTRFGI